VNRRFIVQACFQFARTTHEVRVNMSLDDVTDVQIVFACIRDEPVSACP
jgi:hypothetical protein